MSELLDRLLKQEHRIRPEDVRPFNPGELRELQDIVTGAQATSNRVRAMGVLTAVQGARAIPTLSAVLLDRQQDMAARTGAAAQLGYTTVSASKPLAAALTGEADQTVLGSTIGSLARVGDLAALPELDRIARSGEPVAAQAQFAATLLTFRNRQPGHEPARDSYGDPVAPSGQGEGRLLAHGFRRDEAISALNDLRADNYGVALTGDLTVGLDCADQRLLVALDAGITGNRVDLAGHLGAGPLVAGLIGLRSPVDGSYSTRWLVLTWPDDQVLRVAVHRPSGPPFLLGQVDVHDDTAEFDLTSVQGRGNQRVQLRGAVRAGRLELEGVSSAERIERGTPAPLG